LSLAITGYCKEKCVASPISSVRVPPALPVEFSIAYSTLPATFRKLFIIASASLAILAALTLDGCQLELTVALGVVEFGFPGVGVVDVGAAAAVLPGAVEGDVGVPGLLDVAVFGEVDGCVEGVGFAVADELGEFGAGWLEAAVLLDEQPAKTAAMHAETNMKRNRIISPLQIRRP